MISAIVPGQLSCLYKLRLIVAALIGITALLFEYQNISGSITRMLLDVLEETP